MASILIVDDQPNFRFSLVVTLKREGHEVGEADDAREAIRALERKACDIVITDLRMPGMDGLALLRETKKIDSAIEVVVMTAFGSVDTAVQAMRNGACDYITKPFQPEELVLVVNRTLDRLGLRKRVRDLETIIGETFNTEGIVASSPQMRRILKLIADISMSDGTALVTGESGTGKELIARAVHANSRRKDRSFITINCAALPDTLQESELFGYAKGAFTGAMGNKRGLIEQADTGTLFLDEIALASPSTQSKLLRFLQYGEFRRLGETAERHVNVRMIAATNSKLPALIEEKRFREDLYFRLNVIPIHIPPLRERMEDVPVLANHFLSRFADNEHKGIEGFEPPTMERLLDYTWPGNVRELENAVEYAVMLTRGRFIEESALPPQLLKGGRPSDDGKPKTLEEMEAAHILRVLEATEWNQDKAAGALGIGRTTLWRKLKRYGIAVKRRANSRTGGRK
ncbi:MAG: sigma-54-dependent transcriptional regulator [Planctomycetota bacterium]